MKNHDYIKLLSRRSLVIAGAVFMFFCPVGLVAQQSQRVALPTDGSVAFENSPQGGLRYQRQLYLITPQEMAESQIGPGALNSIGFTIAAAQNDTTIGGFKLFLENTMDEVSRLDLTWSDSISATNSLPLEDLIPGDYEWQVQAVCPSGVLSEFTPLTGFSNAEISGCNQPFNLSATSVADTTVTLNWYAPDSPGFSHYKVEYKAVDEDTWTVVTPNPTTLSVDITGLDTLRTYQWQVRTFCAGDSSQLSASSFTTINLDQCEEPTVLQTPMIGDTLVEFSWDAVTGADRYDIRFRRVGTTFWLATLAFTESVVVNFGLEPGTTYEWEVRTVCEAGQGAYVSGGEFTTDGTAQCYVPEGIFFNNISDTTATLNWAPTSGATSYNIRYRLRNSISWTNAITPMESIAIDNDTIAIPDTIGAFVIPFSAGNTFNYTGGGIYVAFEYSNASGPLSSLNHTLNTMNNSILQDQYGLDSLVVLCLNGRNDTTDVGLPDLLTATTMRPETTFGSESFVDSVAVEVVHALGHYSTLFSGSNRVSALITNFADEEKIYMVDYEVVGAENYSETQSLTVPGDTAVMVSFDSWLPSVDGLDTIRVSIPGMNSENVLSNNEAFYYQTVGPVLIGYDDNSDQVTNAGFGTGEGLILAKQTIDGCGTINAVEVFLDESVANADRSLYAVVVDDGGTILASSFEITPSDNEAGNYHTFYFENPPSVTNETFYVGLAQVANADTSYNPVGVQWETPFIRDSAYYRANLDGSGLVHNPQPGRLMIKAEVIQTSFVPVIEGNPVLCEGGMSTFSVDSLRTVRYANKVFNETPASGGFNTVGFKGKEVLGLPNVFPVEGIAAASWMVAGTVDLNGYIEVGFPGAAPINYIDVYETYNPGGIEAVYAKNPGTGMFVEIPLTSSNETEDTIRINRIKFPLTAFDVSEIRIEMTTDTIYHAIDAIAIGEISLAEATTSFLWSTGDTLSSITTGAAGEYSVTVTNNDGCESSESIELTIGNQTIPEITFQGDSTTVFCEGESVVLVASEEDGIVWSTNDTTSVITVETTGVYFVEYDDGLGCGSTTSESISITVNPLPVANITGDLEICPGGMTTLNAGLGFLTYGWSNGGVDPTITVSNPGNYSVTVHDDEGCSNSATVTTTIASPPVPQITGDLGICPGNSTVLVAENGFLTYEWSNGDMTQNATINTTGVQTVTVTSMNGCQGTGSVTTFNYQEPTPNITGPAGFCTGEAITLNAGAVYNSYVWSTTSSEQMIDVTTEGTYSVTVTNDNGCAGSDEHEVEAFIPPTPPFIAGQLTFCDGNSTILSVGGDLASFIWSTGETTNAISIESTGDFSVTVTDGNGCVGVDMVSTSFDGAIPDIPGPITGPSMGLCGATGLVYFIEEVPNTTHYVWTVPNGMTITSGQGTTQITVDAIADFTSGIIVAKASNSCGQSPTYNQQYLLVQGYPDIPGTPVGPTSGVCNFFTNIYSIDPVGGANSYNWTVPPGATILYGQGTTTIAVNFNNFSGSGDICVDAINGCGVSLCCFGNCLTVNCTTGAIDLTDSGGAGEEEIFEDKPIEEADIFSELGVYPNPNSGQFRLEGNILEAGNFEIMVYSLLGELVHLENRGQRSSGQIKEAVTLPILADGTYIVKVKVGAITWNKKVIIMR